MLKTDGRRAEFLFRLGNLIGGVPGVLDKFKVRPVAESFSTIAAISDSVREEHPNLPG